MKDEGIIEMSRKERERLHVVEKVQSGVLTQRQASERLGIGVRQVKRLCRAVREFEAAGVVSKRRGQPSNRQLEPELKSQALELLRLHYSDFGPTLACEKLRERHDLILSKETVRQLMSADGLWKPRHHKTPAHPRRERRPRRGELVQIDGSLHDWFEKRDGKVTLVCAVDDATGEVLAARFVPVEDTWAYFAMLEELLLEHGRPLQLYSDRHSIFRPTNAALNHAPALTQLSRALEELEIELICANSPQAKGRIERLFGTFQDRLVKELRLEGISDLAAANAFLPCFLKAFNRQFAVVPASGEDALRPLTQEQHERLAQILSYREERMLSKTLTLQYGSRLLQIETHRPEYALRHKKIQVHEDRYGQLEVRYQGELLRHRIVSQPPKQARIADSKEIAVPVPIAPRPKISPRGASLKFASNGFPAKNRNHTAAANAPGP